MERKKPLSIALTIAGSDSGGGAGIQADLKTFEAFGVFGASVITAVTAQNTRRVLKSFYLPPSLVEKQMDAVISDLKPEAAKTGMLGSAGIIKAVAQKVKKWGLSKLVVDPVMFATSGDSLLEPKAVKILKEELLPLALVVTPNLAEAAQLSGFPVESWQEMQEAARQIRRMGPSYVVIKGGHRPSDANDLFYDGSKMITLSSPVLTGKKLHGTGCAFSAAITAGLARGDSPAAAIKAAKAFMIRALKNPLKPGRGAYTLNWRSGAV